MYLKWDDSYSVGVKEIDRQHRKFLEAYNRLIDLTLVGKGDEATEEVLKDLAEYAREHFSYEEGFFDKFGFDEAEEHKGEHKQFIVKVSNYVWDVRHGNKIMSVELLSFIKEWLEHHLKKTDKRYTKCFNEHGLY